MKAEELKSTLQEIPDSYVIEELSILARHKMA
jgi:hypothetical protein